MNLADLNSLLPLAVACVAAMGWLFRLEAQLGAFKTELVGHRTRSDGHEAAIKTAMDGHGSTTIEVVRLQEQIKHLTEVIERLLDRDGPPARRRGAKEAP